MTAPAIADCSGLWRRSLLIGADGTRDTGGHVRWLQGLTGYVDSRGFAGRLEQQGDVFHWLRDVDLEPPGPFPDEGAMHWDGEVLVETGVHQVYAEHWVRKDGPTTPVGAVFLRAPDGADGLWLRVGDAFGWAGGGAVVIGAVGDPHWQRLSDGRSGGGIEVDGTAWTIQRSEGSMQS